MDNDRELLEKAAKAVGIDLDGWSEYGYGFDTVQNPMSWWNPLTDDGDALRLAVKLKLDIEIYRTSTHVYDDKSEKSFEEGHNGDPYAATRRAIVRAAASIGESMV